MGVFVETSKALESCNGKKKQDEGGKWKVLDLTGDFELRADPPYSCLNLPERREVLISMV